MTYIKQNLRTGDKITQEYLDNIEEALEDKQNYSFNYSIDNLTKTGFFYTSIDGTNLFDKSNSELTKDYKQINLNCSSVSDLLQTSSNFKVFGPVNINNTKNLLFSMHTKSAYFDGEDKLVKVEYTEEFPENVEIEIPSTATKVYFQVNRFDVDIFKVVECEKHDPYSKIHLPAAESNFKGSVLYADKLGFVADGVTDNSQKLLDLEALICHNGVSKSENYTIKFGSGTYLFKKDNLEFLSRKEGCATFGLKIEGESEKTTVFKYTPSKNSYFIKNNNKFGAVIFSNFTFEGINTVEVGFCRQVADPHPQLIRFYNVVFKNAAYTMNLKGSDCNSEIKFSDCVWRGYCKKVLSAKRPGISEQFLNYSFIDCDFQAPGGDFIDIDRGGSITVLGGNFIHKDTSGQLEVTGGTFFKLGLNSGAEQQAGICRFLCIGARFECSYPRKSKLLESGWGNNGTITFISCDDSTMTNSTTTIDGTTYKDYEILEECSFNFMYGKPQIRFLNCMLHGKHIFDAKGDYWFSDKCNSIVYDSCVLYGAVNTPYDFLEVKETASGYTGPFPYITFINMPRKFKAYENIPFKRNLIQNVDYSKKYISLKRSDGGFAYTDNSVETNIPVGSLITGFLISAPYGYTKETTPNNIDIWITKGEIHLSLVRIVPTLFLTGDEMIVKKIEEDGYVQTDGLLYKIEFETPIITDNITESTIHFDRVSTHKGNNADNLIAAIEYI